MANITKSLLAALIAAAPLACASAQVNFDDDIYFNPSKDKDKNIEAAKKLKKQQQQRQANAVILYPVEEYPAADTYEAEGTSDRSVDEYNRRGVFGKSKTPSDTITMSAKEYEQFANTRRIERYYNPAIVTASGDDDLEQLYYAEPAEVNIYLNTPGYCYGGYPWGGYWNGWYSPWYGPGWYSPWYGPSWAWGPSWSWGWGPGWGPGWGGVAWHRGNYTPNGRQSTGIRNGYTGVGSSHPGSPFNSRTNGRAGNVTRQSLGNYRPGGSSSTPASNGNVGNYRPGNNASPSYTPSYTPSNSNSGTYRSGRGNSRSSSPSYSSPSPSRSSGGSGWGGGSSRGGGGGTTSRGGRR